MTIKEIVRDAPAGQLARIYFGWKIAPYEDEREGYQLPYSAEHPVGDLQVGASHDVSHSPHPDDQSDEGSEEKEKDQDLESHAANSEAIGPAGRDIERIATEKEKHEDPQPDHYEVKFSPMDRDNPQNWGTGKKAFVFFQIILLTFTGKQSYA